MRFFTFLQLLLLTQLLPAQGVIINEVLTSNANITADEDGENPDWIELYNPSDKAVDITGYGLSENTAKPFKWTFGKYIMQPKEYLQVFASGKNRQGGSLQPTEVEGLMAWFSAQDLNANDPDQVITKEGVSQVKKWLSHDRKYYLQQTKEGAQPTLVQAALGNAPSVRFNGTGDFLEGNIMPPTGSQPRTIIVMLANVDVDNLNQDWDNYIMRYGSDDQMYSFSFKKKIQGNTIGNNYKTGSFYGTGKLTEEPTFISQVYSGDVNTFYVNGTFSGQHSITFNTGNRFLLCVGSTTGGRASYFGGDILDIMIFEKALSVEERRRVENLLAQKYSLQSQLFHTNFSLSASGETLLLTAPGGTEADRMLIPALSTNQSYGVSSSGGYAYFGTPTPGAVNNTEAFAGEMEPPVFSHYAGFYKNDFALTLQSDDPDAVILYTLDGSVPDMSAVNGVEYQVKYDYKSDQLTTRKATTFIYEKPIQITQTGNDEAERYKITSSMNEWEPQKYAPGHNAMVVRAACLKKGAIKSAVITQTFLVNPNASSEMTLPVVSVVTPDTALFSYETGIYVPGLKYDETKNEKTPEANYNQGKWERPAHFELFDASGTLLYNSNAGVRIHGNYSAHRPRKSFRLEAKKKFGGESLFNYPLIPGLRPDSKVGSDEIGVYNAFLLRNSGNNSNACLFQDAMVHRLISHLNTSVQGSLAVHHFLNGEYWGIMNIREHFDEEYFKAHYNINTSDIVIANLRDKEIKTGYSYEYKELNDISDFISANPGDSKKVYDYISARMDIENYLTHFVLNIYVNGGDFLENNKKMWKKRASGSVSNAPFGHDGRWRWIFYDADQSLSDANRNTLKHALDNGGASTLRAILDDEEGRNQFINFFCDNMNTTFGTKRAISVLDSMKTEMEVDIRTHIQRWNNIKADQKYDQFVEFLNRRPSQMRQHLREQYSLSDSVFIRLNTDVEQGTITINSVKIDSGTIGLNDPAKPYPWEGCYFKEVPVRLIATPRRGYVFSHWSNQETSDTIYVSIQKGQEITAYFKPVSAGQQDLLIISEVNYSSSDEQDAGDWVEFYNPQGHAVDISGWIFRDDDDSHTYIFPDQTFVPASGYIVLCQNYEKFTAIYPTVTNYRGNMNFGLGNKGDHLRLYDNIGLLIDEVQYTNKAPWPTDADNTGRTIELRNLSLDNSQGASWQSSPIGGTPGRINSWPVGIEDVTYTRSELVFYPNPCADELTVELPEEQVGSVLVLQVYTMLGQPVLYQKIAGNSTVKVFTGDLPTGTYLLSVQGEKGYTGRSVFIKK